MVVVVELVVSAADGRAALRAGGLLHGAATLRDAVGVAVAALEPVAAPHAHGRHHRGQLLLRDGGAHVLGQLVQQDPKTLVHHLQQSHMSRDRIMQSDGHNR